ncbi:Cilia- and flagella-associated protein 251 [Sparganum proliferum]
MTLVEDEEKISNANNAREDVTPGKSVQNVDAVTKTESAEQHHPPGKTSTLHEGDPHSVTKTTLRVVMDRDERNLKSSEVYPRDTETYFDQTINETEDFSALNDDSHKPETSMAASGGGRPNTNTSNRAVEEPKGQTEPREVLKPVRVLGFNQNVPVINLSTGRHMKLFYTSAHLGVIYDVGKNEQVIMRGHVNTIRSTCCSKDKRWLVTGDSGPDNAVILWDAKTVQPVRTMLDTYPNGVVGVALTPDARYLATLSSDIDNQIFSIWDWTTGSDEPLCYTNLSPDFGLQTKIAFKEDDYFHVMTNSETQVIFYDWNLNGPMQSYAPPLSNETFKQSVGKFSNSTYLPFTTTALTGTSRGILVVWQTSHRPKKAFTQESCYKSAVKLVPMHKAAITFLGITSCVSTGVSIVTGDAEGRIRFSDPNFLLLYWYNEARFGEIMSISFADRGLIDGGLTQFANTKYPEDATIPREKFVVEDFVVSTSHAVLASIGVEGKVVKLIQREEYSIVNAVATHPKLDLVTVAGYCGMVKTWNYKSILPVKTRIFDKGTEFQSCAYDPNGQFLAVGCTSGRVMMLDGVDLNDTMRRPIDFAKGIVTQLAFSHDSEYFAYVDSEMSTTLLKRVSPEQGDLWQYVGRYRAHSRPIVDLMFHTSANYGYPRLLTLGEDRMIVEYDVPKSKDGNLELRTRTRVEQRAVPRCFASMGRYYKEDFICIANSESKLKLINVVTLMCRKTVLAPLQCPHYRRILALPEKETENTPPSSPLRNCLKYGNHHCLIFLTNERLGLVLLPLDGDPYKTVNVIAHPSCERGSGYATGLAVSRDGRIAFTTGGPDNSIHMWKIDRDVLTAQASLYSDDMVPFYNMLTPELLNDLKDYFYLALLRQQGISSMDTRITAEKIPITEIPFVMRAIGFFPTDEQIELMMNEVKFSAFYETGHYTDSIDLDTFIKLYINHRDRHGTLLDEITQAFWAIKSAKRPCTPLCPHRNTCPDVQGKGEPVLDRNHLLTVIQTLGEPVRHDELVDDLAVLLGLAPEAGHVEDPHALDHLSVSDEIEKRLPLCFTPRSFAEQLLAMELCKDLPVTLDTTRDIEVPPVTAIADVQTTNCMSCH